MGVVRKTAVAVSIALSMSGALPASASTLTYNFTATAAGGPLAGDVFGGVLTVDSASVAAGSGAASIVSFNVLGTVITASQGLFGLVPKVYFDPAGALNGLANFTVASTARAAIGNFGGGIALPASISSISFDYNFNYGTDPSQGETFRGGAVAGRVASILPEPASLLLAGAGLGALGLIRRRRAA